MKSVYLRILSVIFCAVFITINSFAQDAALKEKFQKMDNEMIKNMLTDNTEAMMSMYTDDAISMPSYEPMLKGKDEMIGAIPFGILLCCMALLTNSIVLPFLIHLSLALSTDLFSIHHNPKMKLV